MDLSPFRTSMDREKKLRDILGLTGADTVLELLESS